MPTETSERSSPHGSPNGPTTPRRKMKHHVNNTCGTSSRTKRLTRQLAGIMAHLEKNPRDTLSQQRVATINQLLRQ